MLPESPSAERIRTVCLMVLAGVAGTYAIYWLRPVLMPLVVALFVVSGVSPVLSTLEKRLHVNRLIAAGLTFLAGLAILFTFGLSIWVSTVDMSQNAPDYRKRVREIVSTIEEQVLEFVPGFLSDKSRSTEEIEQAANRTVSKDKAEQFVDAMVRDAISVVSQAMFSLISNSIVVLIYVFFLLLGAPIATDHSSTIRQINSQIRSYLSLKTVISIFTGLAFGLALQLFGVPMAFTFGVLAFLLNFVPNIGPLVASLLPIPLIVLHPDATIGWMVTAISVICAIQAISGNVIEPRVMGNSSNLHPVTILVGLMFWGMMWGVIGMFLATPIISALRIMLDRIDSTRPIADLMAGKLPNDDESLFPRASST